MDDDSSLTSDLEPDFDLSAGSTWKAKSFTPAEAVEALNARIPTGSGAAAVMGGAAFKERGLYTPRMPLEVYATIQKSTQERLSQLYDVVVSPIEAPQKTNFGDVDFLVCQPLSNSSAPSPESVAAHLKAGSTIIHDSARLTVAVPYSVYDLNDTDSHEPTPLEPHVQIDISIMPNALSLQWLHVLHSHGDLFQIIGVSLRPFHLTFKPDGMRARIPEIERLNKPGSEVWLTQSYTAVFDFLGLDISTYERGFQTEEQVFDFAVSGRFFDRRVFLAGPRSEIGQGVDGPRVLETKSNDRRRMTYRDSYRRFVNEYLPARPSLGQCNASLHLFAQQEALARFGKTEEAQERLHQFLQERKESEFWSQVQRHLENDPFLDTSSQTSRHAKALLVVRGMKRWVVPPIAAKGSFVVRDAAELDAAKQSCWASEVDEVQTSRVTWILDHCRQIYEREHERSKESKRKRMLERAVNQIDT